MTGELIDIHEGSAKTNRVDTEHLLKLLEWKTIEAGINKYTDLQAYRNCVEQMEILATGSTLLGKAYKKKKKDLSAELKKKQEQLMKGARPGMKKSILNQRIKQDISDLEVEFVTEWHRILMFTLGRIFYTHYKLETI